jgi:Tfp pilus assembly protein PilF/thiol-disulfide isomerase/thioredoxin
MSWSGNERNCVFLNTPGSRFANISAVSGFDFADDGRSLGLVDWDFDGDLDFWAANRTGPRLRFMRNDATTDQHFAAFRLRARSGNRDAIGARLELHVVDGDRRERLIKSLRAGEGFLGQSTKWIHFGLGTISSINGLVVHWPGGTVEHFDVPAVDRHYVVVQGSGQLDAWQAPERTTPPAQVALEPAEADGRVQTLLPARIALPSLEYTTLEGASRRLADLRGRPVLVNLWASWCQPCLEELTELARRKEELRADGIELLALSVDGLSDGAEVDAAELRDLADQLDITFAIGTASATLVDTLQIYHDALFKPHRALPLPTSVLLDAEGRLAGFYKGPVSIDVLRLHSAWLDESGPRLLDASLPFPGRWVSAPRALQLLPIAAQLVEHGQIEAASELADSPQASQLRHEPGFVQLLYRLGRHALEQHDVNRALAQFHRALEISPDDADGFFNLAIAREAQGDSAAAVELYQRAIAAHPAHAQAINNLGNIYVTRGEVDRARELYLQAIEANPQLAQVHFNLGLVYSSEQNSGEAARCFRHAIEIDPGHSAAHNNLGIILAQQNQLADATEHYRQAVQFDPDYATAHNNLANALALQGKLAESVDHYRRAVALDAQLADAHDNLGRVLLAMDQPGDAIASLRQAAELRPDRAETTSLLAWLLATHPNDSLRDPQQAIHWAQRAVESTARRDPRALDVLAAALARAGRFDEAVQTADQAIRLLEATDRSSQSEPIQSRRDGYRQRQPFTLRTAQPRAGPS